MHSFGPDVHSIVRQDHMMVSWVGLVAIVAFAVLILILLVKRFGAFGTLGWGFSLLFVGLIGLSLLMFQLLGTGTATHVRVTENAGVISSSDTSSVGVAEAYDEYETLLNRPNRQTESIMDGTRNDRATTSAWDESIAPVANIYPSIPDCGRALAAKLAKQLQKTKRSPDELRKAEKIRELLNPDEPKDESPKAEPDDSVKYRVALINENGEQLDQSDFLNFVIKFREQFTSSFPSSLVEDMTREADSKATGTVEGAYQHLQVTVSKLGSKFHDNVRSGQIVCQFKRDDRGKIELVSDYVEKKWVADPVKFVATNTNQNLIVGLSPRFASSQQEARLAAFKDAEIQLAKSTGKNFQQHYGLEKYAVDQFVQKLTMPYGNVWRAAVMIDGRNGPYVQYASGDTAVRMAKRGDSTTARGEPAAAVPVAVADSRSRPNPESIGCRLDSANGSHWLDFQLDDSRLLSRPRLDRHRNAIQYRVSVSNFHRVDQLCVKRLSESPKRIDTC